MANKAPETAHRIGHDPWWQLGFFVFTGFNAAYVLSYSKIIMSYLGWTLGTLSLVLIPALAIYSYQLLASLHYTGGKRNIRYRDLAETIYGRKMFFTTWLVQHVHLFLVAIGYIILAGQSLKGLYRNLTDDGTLKLCHWITISGGIMFLMAVAIPHLSALRLWLAMATVMTFVYIIIVFIFVVRDGLDNHAKDYQVHGSSLGKVFNAVGAMTNIVFAYGCTMLPELQATLKDPAIRNMKTALYVGFGTGSAFMYTMTFTGYWAYGSQVSSYLLNNVQGPKAALAVANIAVFIQSIVSAQAFSFPIFEFLDTKFARRDEPSPWSWHTVLVRITGRGMYIVAATFFAAFLPFIGDFSSLTGATSTIPLTFVLPNHMYLRVMRARLSTLQVAWHYFNAIFFTFLIILATISSVRSIILDFDTYHVFADL